MWKDVNHFMNAKFGQGVIVKFLLSEKRDAVEIHHKLLQAFQKDGSTLSYVCAWITAFKAGRTSVLDEGRAGRPRLDHINSRFCCCLPKTKFIVFGLLHRSREFLWAWCMTDGLACLGSRCVVHDGHSVCSSRDSRPKWYHFNWNVADSSESDAGEFDRSCHRGWVLVLVRVFPKLCLGIGGTKVLQKNLTKNQHGETHAHSFLVHWEATGWGMVTGSWHV
jgi:hypothetical protein